MLLILKLYQLRVATGLPRVTLPASGCANCLHRPSNSTEALAEKVPPLAARCCEGKRSQDLIALASLRAGLEELHRVDCLNEGEFAIHLTFPGCGSTTPLHAYERHMGLERFVLRLPKGVQQNLLQQLEFIGRQALGAE